MDTMQAVRKMLDDSGKGIREVGTELGKSPTYLSSILTRGSVPRADTLAAIADVLGYRVELVGRGKERIRIDPPAKG